MLFPTSEMQHAEGTDKHHYQTLLSQAVSSNDAKKIEEILKIYVSYSNA